MSKFFEATQRLERRLTDARSSHTRQQSVTATAADFHAAEPAPPAVPANGRLSAVSSNSRSIPEFRLVSVHPAAGALLPAFAGTNAKTMERYRLVRTKIVQHPRKPRILCISSASPADGKTVSAFNTAASLALKSDTTVLLVDADLRRPQLARSLGLPGTPGLAEVLAGTCTLEDAVVRIAELPGLYFLPAGHNSANPTELLDSARWRELADRIQNTFTFGIFDSPPVGLLADYDLIQSVCDGILLIVRPGHTKRHLLQKTLDQMPADKFLGVVVNAADDWFLWRTHDYYYNSYYTTCQTHE